MIKKALEYVIGLSEAKIQNINGDVYSDKPLCRIDPYYPLANAISMSNLSSLVEYINSDIDSMHRHMIVQVISPTDVRLISQLNENRERETLVEVRAQIPSFNYGQFMDSEAFCIGVQSKFIDDSATDKALLLKFAGTVEAGTVAQYGDDGVSQKATVKTGIASKSEAIVPNPVNLKPFRTFPECEQPVSAFIFRMRQGGNGVNCALFEADGGAWKNDAMKYIADYLINNIENKECFTIIS